MAHGQGENRIGQCGFSSPASKGIFLINTSSSVFALVFSLKQEHNVWHDRLNAPTRVL
jgi:hypothetical protein